MKSGIEPSKISSPSASAKPHRRMTPSEIDRDLRRSGYLPERTISQDLDEGRRAVGFYFAHPQGWKLERAS